MSETKSFQKDLWNKFEDVCQKVVSAKKGTTKQVHLFLDEQISCEDHAAKGMNKACRNIQAIPEIGTLKEGISSIRQCHENNSVSRVNMATLIKAEVSQPLEAMRQDQSKSNKKLMAEGHKLDKELAKQKHVTKSAKEKYYKASVEKDQAVSNMAASRGDPSVDPNTIKKLANKEKNAFREVEKTDKEYRKQVEKLHGMEQAYDSRMGQILAELENAEKMRISRTKQLLQRYNEIHLEYIEELQRHVQTCVAGVNAIDARTDLDEYINTHTTNTQPPPYTVYEGYGEEPSTPTARISAVATSSAADIGMGSTGVMTAGTIAVGAAASHNTDEQSSSASLPPPPPGGTSPGAGGVPPPPPMGGIPPPPSQGTPPPPPAGSTPPPPPAENTPPPPAPAAAAPPPPTAAVAAVAAVAAPPPPPVAAAPPPPAAAGPRRVAQFDFVASEDAELSMKAGDVIEVLMEDDSGWWQGRIGNREGMFPENYTKPA